MYRTQQKVRVFLDFLYKEIVLFISVSFDKMTQDRVAVVKKLQKSTCIMRGFALIYKRIDSYMGIGKYEGRKERDIMLNSGIYDYIDVWNKAADAAWLRDTAIVNNIANGDTPGYKRQDVDFEGVLERELGKTKYVSLDDKVSNLHMNHLNVSIYTDAENYSYRLDENNVDPEQEQAKLVSNRIKYNALIDTMSKEFARIKSVIK